MDPIEGIFAIACLATTLSGIALLSAILSTIRHPADEVVEFRLPVEDANDLTARDKT
jgi:hypothetical protein